MMKSGEFLLTVGQEVNPFPTRSIDGEKYVCLIREYHPHTFPNVLTELGSFFMKRIITGRLQEKVDYLGPSPTTYTVVCGIILNINHFLHYTS